MLIDNIQAKNFVKFDFMKIMIHLAWVANSMVIFSASYQNSFRIIVKIHLKDIEKGKFGDFTYN